MAGSSWGTSPIAADVEVSPFIENAGEPTVRGVLHRPARPTGRSIVLTHGAGSSCEAPLLVALGDALAADAVTVLRCDLPFRQARPHGPPSPAGAVRDREGLRRAVSALRSISGGDVWLGGQSYGGRQATMLAADDPTVAAALLVLSYPLRPLRPSSQDRTAHLARLETPALFVHGSRDPFGSPADMSTALSLIPARTELLEVTGAGHDLGGARKASAVAARIAAAFRRFTE